MGAINSRASPEPERTVVTLPRENPEIEPLAGASERQGATVSVTYPLSDPVYVVFAEVDLIV